MKVKVGEEIKFKEDFDIETFGGRKINVKEGDRGIVTGNGFIKHLNGNARGMMQKIEGLDVNGYDYENISKMIFNRLNNLFGIKLMLEDEEIEHKEFIEEIQDVLSDIL